MKILKPCFMDMPIRAKRVKRIWSAMSHEERIA